MFEKMRFIGLPELKLLENGKNPGKEIVTIRLGISAVLDAVPESLVIRFTGRSQYKLYVNGRSVNFGPLRSQAQHAYVDELELAPYLKEGENRLTAEAWSYPSSPAMRKYEGPSNCYPDDRGPAIAAEGLIGETDLSLAGNWRVMIDPALDYNDYQLFLLGPTEFTDLAKRNDAPLFDAEVPGAFPAEFLEPGAYTETGERLTRSFEVRPLPLLYRKERSFLNGGAYHFAAGTKASFVLNAGGLTTGYPRFLFSQSEGAVVRFTYAESYFHKGENGWPYKEVRDDETGYIDGVFDEIRPDPAEEKCYEPFTFRTFRFVKVDVETKDAPLTLTVLPYIETAYPLVNDRRPVIEDPKKQKLYDVALRTLQLCMHDTYEDCPYYEQLMYEGDSRLEILFTYAATSDTRLPEYAIRLFASSLLPEGLTQARFPSRKLQIIPDFSLYFVLMLEDYIKETGNAEKMAPYIPAAERVIETFLSKRTKNGLIAPQGWWEYYDWTIQWHRGTPNALKDTGESTILNLLFCYAAESFARILPLFHRSELAAYYNGEVQEILKKVRALTYDPERGLLQDAPGYPEYTQHSQIYGVLTGLFTGEEAKEVMEKVLSDKSLIQCSFVQRFYLFRALEKAGMYERTEELWADWQHFIDLHCTTFPETPFRPRSDCHAWSALPLYEFSRKN